MRRVVSLWLGFWFRPRMVDDAARDGDADARRVGDGADSIHAKLVIGRLTTSTTVQTTATTSSSSKLFYDDHDELHFLSTLFTC